MRSGAAWRGLIVFVIGIEIEASDLPQARFLCAILDRRS